MQDDDDLRSSAKRQKKRPHRPFREKLASAIHSGVRKISEAVHGHQEDEGSPAGGTTTTTIFLGPIPIHTYTSTKSAKSTTGNKVPDEFQLPSEESLMTYQQMRTIGGFNDADRHALSAPSEQEETVQSLAQYLIGPYQDNELMKARVLFRWITSRISYNVKAFLSGKKCEISAKDVLKARSTVCEGYANLFYALAKEAKLEAYKVGGAGKGGNFGTTARTAGLSHAWNVVSINGEWNLLDACWGAGHVDGRTGQFEFAFEEFFFLTRPEHFIYTHLPADPVFQLLSKDAILSTEQFDALPHVHINFFDYGIQLVSHKSRSISASTDDELCIELKADNDVVFLAELHGQKRRTFAHRNPATGLQEIIVRPPKEGDYFLEVFARRREEDADEGGASHAYGILLEYGLQVKGDRVNDRWLFPKAFGDFELRNHYLYSPTELYLDNGTTQHFKLYGGGEAMEMTAHHQGKRIPLKCTNHQENLFEGDVVIGRGDLTIYVRYPSDAGHHAILKYNYNLGDSNA